MEFLSHSKEDTIRFAHEYAKSLRSGDVVALQGDLGSGKTTFTQGLSDALNVKDRVTSPTFVIMKNYLAHIQQKDITLNHIDCYRISEIDADAIGLSEIFDDKNSVTILEWPENISKILPSRTKTLLFEYLNESDRKITY